MFWSLVQINRYTYVFLEHTELEVFYKPFVFVLNAKALEKDLRLGFFFTDNIYVRYILLTNQNKPICRQRSTQSQLTFSENRKNVAYISDDIANKIRTKQSKYICIFRTNFCTICSYPILKKNIRIDIWFSSIFLDIFPLTNSHVRNCDLHCYSIFVFWFFSVNSEIHITNIYLARRLWCKCHKSANCFALPLEQKWINRWKNIKTIYNIWKR